MTLKVLFISPVPTDPCTAGNRGRIASLTREVVALGHDVHFAFIPMETADIEVMARRFGRDKLHVLSFRPRAESLARKYLKKIARGLRFDWGFRVGVDEWYDFGLNEQIATLQALHKFDVVFVEYVFCSAALVCFSGEVLKVLDTHDSFGNRHKAYLSAGEKPRWFSTAPDEEIKGFRRADVVLAIQEGEARSFSKGLGPETSTSVVSVGHLVEVRDAIVPSDGDSAIFLGSDNPINTAAARWFISEVLPRVRRAIPEFRFKLAGGVCDTIEASEGVDCLGFVERLEDAFACAAINVNPVHMGTGLNIKLLDALAHGVASISTHSGARGFEVVAESALIVVGDRDADSFAAHIVRLMKNRELLLSYSIAAHQAALAWNDAQRENLARVLFLCQSR